MVKSPCLTGRETMTSPQWSYREIAADIARRIIAGEWPIGGRVPTTRAFAADYGVHVNTAEKALALLKERGLIIGERGGGRFVAGGQ